MNTNQEISGSICNYVTTEILALKMARQCVLRTLTPAENKAFSIWMRASDKWAVKIQQDWGW